MPDIFDSPDLQALIKERVDSRDWWLLWVSPDLSGVIKAIAGRFYPWPRKDFDRVIGLGSIPGNVFWLAHKRRMPRELLARWAKQKGYPIYTSDPEQDILVMVGPTRGSKELAAEFTQWITAMYFGDDRPRLMRMSLN